jgi:hypothetical protein
LLNQAGEEMPIQRTTAIPVKVRNAISVASERTGASFDYLLNTAKRESGFRANARSRHSSATGLFQFVEGTWLKMVKDEGERLGLGKLASNIRKTSSGRYFVPDSRRRREILGLRNDPKISALVAAAYTEHNARYVSHRIGRTPSDGELYMAHFLGPGNAARMILLADNRPDEAASRYFPKAAKANRSIFYEGKRPRSLAEVREILISSHIDESSSGGRIVNSGSSSFYPDMGSLITDIRGRRDFSSGRDVSGGERRSDGGIGVWGDEISFRPLHEAAPRRKAAASERPGRKANSAGSASAAGASHREASNHYRSMAQKSPRYEEAEEKLPGWANEAFEK